MYFVDWILTFIIFTFAILWVLETELRAEAKIIFSPHIICCLVSEMWFLKRLGVFGSQFRSWVPWRPQIIERYRGYTNSEGIYTTSPLPSCLPWAHTFSRPTELVGIEIKRLSKTRTSLPWVLWKNKFFNNLIMWIVRTVGGHRTKYFFAVSVLMPITPRYGLKGPLHINKTPRACHKFIEAANIDCSQFARFVKIMATELPRP